MQERGECIRAFLLAPLSPRRFRTFFDLRCATTIGLLKYYRSRGYPVPIERADTQAGYHDGGATESVTHYLGARIGSSNGEAIEIAELRAYGVATSEAQRKFKEGELVRKYGGL